MAFIIGVIVILDVNINWGGKDCVYDHTAYNEDEDVHLVLRILHIETEILVNKGAPTFWLLQERSTIRRVIIYLLFIEQPYI
jgi:hypothetical protein